MSLIKVTTCKQPVQQFECYITSKKARLIECGRIALEIGNKSGIDRYSGIHRYLLDEGKYAWMPVKERLVVNPAPTIFKGGVASYYAETLSAGHPTRLWGWDDLRGPIFL